MLPDAEAKLLTFAGAVLNLLRDTWLTHLAAVVGQLQDVTLSKTLIPTLGASAPLSPCTPQAIHTSGTTRICTARLRLSQRGFARSTVIGGRGEDIAQPDSIATATCHRAFRPLVPLAQNAIMVMVDALTWGFFVISWVARFHLLQWHEAHRPALPCMILFDDPLPLADTKTGAAAIRPCIPSRKAAITITTCGTAQVNSFANLPV